MGENRKNFIISAITYHIILIWGVMFKFSWTDHLSIWEQQTFTIAERFQMGMAFFDSFHSNEDAIIDMVLNCLIFIPSGVYLAGLMKWWKVLLCGLFLTLGVEFTQLIVALGGFSITDIISNFTGAGVGVLLFKTCLCRVNGKLWDKVNRLTAILFSVICVYAVVSVIVVFPKYYEWVEG